MTHLNLIRRASILGAFVALTSFTPSAFTPLGLAADDRPDTTTAATAATGSAARPDVATSAAPAPERCSFISPCQVARTSYGVELDLGGPGIRIEYFSNDE